MFGTKISALREQLIDCICRPDRDEYTLDQLIGGSKRQYCIQQVTGVRQDLELTNKYNQRLKCSLFSSQSIADADEPAPFVIYCHCNSGSRRDAEEAILVLIPMGIQVLAIDFAGSGLSDGSHVTLGAREVDDLEAAVLYLRSSGKASTIALWGRSMGAVTALLYSQRDPSIAGMVLDSPFSRLTSLMQELVKYLRLPIPRPLSKVALAWVRRSVKRRADFDIYDVAPIDSVKASFIPALFGHADGDTFIPVHHSQALHDAYAGDKNFIKFSGDHNSVRPPFFYHSVSIFLQNVLQVSPQALEGSSSRRRQDYSFAFGCGDTGGDQITGDIPNLTQAEWDSIDKLCNSNLQRTNPLRGPVEGIGLESVTGWENDTNASDVRSGMNCVYTSHGGLGAESISASVLVDDEDDQLLHAIQLSLQEQKQLDSHAEFVQEHPQPTRASPPTTHTAPESSSNTMQSKEKGKQCEHMQNYDSSAVPSALTSCREGSTAVAAAESIRFQYSSSSSSMCSDEYNSTRYTFDQTLSSGNLQESRLKAVSGDQEAHTRGRLLLPVLQPLLGQDSKKGKMLLTQPAASEQDSQQRSSIQTAPMGPLKQGSKGVSGQLVQESLFRQNSEKCVDSGSSSSGENSDDSQKWTWNPLQGDQHNTSGDYYCYSAQSMLGNSNASLQRNRIVNERNVEGPANRTAQQSIKRNTTDSSLSSTHMQNGFLASPRTIAQHRIQQQESCLALSVIKGRTEQTDYSSISQGRQFSSQEEQFWQQRSPSNVQFSRNQTEQHRIRSSSQHVSRSQSVASTRARRQNYMGNPDYKRSNANDFEFSNTVSVTESVVSHQVTRSPQQRAPEPRRCSGRSSRHTPQHSPQRLYHTNSFMQQYHQYARQPSRASSSTNVETVQRSESASWAAAAVRNAYGELTPAGADWHDSALRKTALQSCNARLGVASQTAAYSQEIDVQPTLGKRLELSTPSQHPLAPRSLSVQTVSVQVSAPSQRNSGHPLLSKVFPVKWPNRSRSRGDGKQSRWPQRSSSSRSVTAYDIESRKDNGFMQSMEFAHSQKLSRGQSVNSYNDLLLRSRKNVQYSCVVP